MVHGGWVICAHGGLGKLAGAGGEYTGALDDMYACER